MIFTQLDHALNFLLCCASPLLGKLKFYLSPSFSSLFCSLILVATSSFWSTAIILRGGITCIAQQQPKGARSNFLSKIKHVTPGNKTS